MANQELKKVGLKATLPRIRILEILEDQADSHMSAEDVYKALIEAGEDVGLATIYRVLTQFESAGLVHRHNFDGGHAVFEIAKESHHDHMVVVESGEVIEFVDEEIEARQKEIAEQHGYELVEHSLVLYVKPKT
ncbi:MAG: ferric iron uptake transcriptional regulator [Pseudomonadota bacterium]